MAIECHEDFELKNLTSYKIGGHVKKVYFPKSIGEFEEILAKESAVRVFGSLSNTIVSSDGYDGVIILTSKMDKIVIEGNKVYVQCGVKGPKLAQMVQRAGLTGFEFMIGFPGSVGGNVYMNASAHGQCISDNLVNVKCWSKEKGIFELSKEEMNFSYRASVCQSEPYIVLGAEFMLESKEPYLIQDKMNENLSFRKSHQPSMASPNCGSMFKNPEGNSAGKILDEAGAKSFFAGGAKVWDFHANFIINRSNATSVDVLDLMYQMYVAVKEKFGIELKPEVKYLGNKNAREVELCKILNIK